MDRWGSAWKDYCGPKYRRARLAAFQRTGLAMTLGRTNDHIVIVEGLEIAAELVPLGVPFDDEAYMAHALSERPDCNKEALVPVADVALVPPLELADASSEDEQGSS